MRGLLLVASLSFGAPALGHTGFSSTGPRGTVPDQGLNPCPLHWQVNSRPLDHQGSPEAKALNVHWFQSTEVMNGGDRMLDVAWLIKNRKDRSDDRLQVPDRLPMFGVWRWRWFAYPGSVSIFLILATAFDQRLLP